MGGNALQEPSIRLNKDDYFSLTNILLNKLSKLDNYKFYLISAYKNKESYGDADILVYSDKYNPQEIYKNIDAIEFVGNGTCTSMGINTEKGIFQVDFIYSPIESFDVAKNYFNFCDLGNILGRVYKSRAGFKFGHDGLFYVLRDENNDKVIEEILITLDLEKMYSLMEYRYDPNWIPNDLEEIFRYAASSKYFSSDIYLFENVNNASKVRDRKRKTYNSLLKWLKETDYKYPEFKVKDKTELRKQFLYKSFDLFPEFKKKYDAAIIKNNNIKSAKDKFNGEIIKNLIPTLEGKRLGQFITSFKKSREEKGDFINYINNLSKEEVEQQILWHISIFNMETDKEMAKNEYKNI